jgi:ketosteroid isomerase-like protein
MSKNYLTSVVIYMTVLAAEAQVPSDSLAAVRAEILPLINAMEAAANDHDAEKHVSFYAKDPSLLFVINDRAIIGWDALLKQQQQWWHDGKTDVKYELIGKMDFQMPAPGLVMLTYFLRSHRTLSDGQTSDSRFGISLLWKKRPEGWRIIYAHESVVTE